MSQNATASPARVNLWNDAGTKQARIGSTAPWPGEALSGCPANNPRHQAGM